MKPTKKLIDILLRELLEEVAEKCHFEMHTNTHGMDLWIFGRYEDFFLHIYKGKTSSGKEFASFHIDHGIAGRQQTLFTRKVWL